MQDIHSALHGNIEVRGIPIFVVTGVDGYEHVPPDGYPPSPMPRCKSAIIFGRPFEYETPNLVGNEYIDNDA